MESRLGRRAKAPKCGRGISHCPGCLAEKPASPSPRLSVLSHLRVRASPAVAIVVRTLPRLLTSAPGPVVESTGNRVDATKPARKTGPQGLPLRSEVRTAEVSDAPLDNVTTSRAMVVAGARSPRYAFSAEARSSRPASETSHRLALLVRLTCGSHRLSTRLNLEFQAAVPTGRGVVCHDLIAATATREGSSGLRRLAFVTRPPVRDGPPGTERGRGWNIYSCLWPPARLVLRRARPSESIRDDLTQP